MFTNNEAMHMNEDKTLFMSKVDLIKYFSFSFSKFTVSCKLHGMSILFKAIEARFDSDDSDVTRP